MKAIAFLISKPAESSVFQGVFRLSAIFSLIMVSILGASAQEHVHDDDCSALFGGKTSHSIQYGQSLTAGVFNQTSETPSWEVRPAKGVSPSSGKGNFAEGVQFNEPGRYEVVFTVPGDPHKGISEVMVSETRMVFDLKSVVLSNPIKAGVPTDGTTLTISVEFSSYNKKPVTYGAVKLSTTGVSGIVAELKEPVTMKKGTHKLTFQLSGTPEHAGAAQLGFFNLLGEGFFYNFLIAE